MSQQSKVINFNVGVVGHVDSGKTSLVKKLSQVASTAAFDKNPQSQERGITLDLGFSSFQLALPPRLKSLVNEDDASDSKNCGEKIQITLVDCPGHASLIKTVIAAAQIIDLMILVVDVAKGIQTQTGECLVLGEIVDNCDHLIAVINKVDLIPEGNERQHSVEKLKKRILKVLETTKFKSSPVVAVAASPSADSEMNPIGLESLIETISDTLFIPKRPNLDPTQFLMAADHCFSIRGQGTVVTGTVIQGSAKVNDTVEISTLKITKKIKSMQMFKKPIQDASQGDRIAICVTQFDPKLLERGFISFPNLIKTAFAFIADIQKIKYFKETLKSKTKLHVTLMHETVMGNITLFASDLTNEKPDESKNFDIDREYKYIDEYDDKNKENINQKLFALIQLQGSISATTDSLLIASKLDTDINSNSCRIAFSGHVVKMFTTKDYQEKELQELKIFKTKSKQGIVERHLNENEVIVKNMFKKETNLELFRNLKVKITSGEDGVIDGSFGTSGKIKIRIPNGLTNFEGKSSKKKAAGDQEPVKVYLNFKRYVFDKSKKIVQ